MKYDNIVRKIIKETDAPVVVYSTKGNKLFLWAKDQEYSYTIGKDFEKDIRKAIESTRVDRTDGVLKGREDE